MGPIALNSLLEQAIELTRNRWCDIPLQRGVGLRLSWELAPDLPSVLGRESEIRDAVIEFIARAVDAMPYGGSLTLRTFAVLDEDRPGVALEISDTGCDGSPSQSGATTMPTLHLGPPAATSGTLIRGADVEVRRNPSHGTTVALLFRAAPEPSSQHSPA